MQLCNHFRQKSMPEITPWIIQLNTSLGEGQHFKNHYTHHCALSVLQIFNTVCMWLKFWLMWFWSKHGKLYRTEMLFAKGKTGSIREQQGLYYKVNFKKQQSKMLKTHTKHFNTSVQKLIQSCSLPKCVWPHCPLVVVKKQGTFSSSRMLLLRLRSFFTLFCTLCS